VALTFDAEHPDRPRWASDAPERILDALAAAGVRATFFVQGRWASAYPDRARRMSTDGHLIGHHSHYDVRSTLLRDEGIRADVATGEERITAATGVDPRPWFRCPFGDGHDDPRVLAVLHSLGYRNVHWHVELEDWEPWTTAADIARGAVAGAARYGAGTVVLLHAWPSATADAVPAIIARLREAGARWVTVDELAILP
jgi:peptidoglycan/xylan/chitin deacetylase (PgdA/CDA1 family)